MDALKQNIAELSTKEQDELMLMTSTGQSIRIRVNEIRETGRVAQGVKLLTLKEGEKLQDVSIFIPDGEDASGDQSASEDQEANTETGTEETTE
jgi:DNA gyrase subunit A